MARRAPQRLISEYRFGQISVSRTITKRWTDGAQDAAYAGSEIDGGVKNAIYQRGGLTSGGVTAGRSGRGKIKWDTRLLRAQTADERQGGGNFADRDGMQPDGAGLRPRERLGQKAETLTEMVSVGGEEDERPRK